MAFTDRYIKLPVKIVDRKMQEMIGDTESEDSFIMINPFEILKYRPSWDNDDKDQSEITCMTDKNGDTTLIYLTIAEFEKVLNEFQR